MIDIAILRASGLSDEQILRVLEEEQRARREHERIRKRNQRSCPRDSRDNGDSRDNSAAYVSKKEERKKERNIDASLRSARKCALPADFDLTEADNRFCAERGWSASKTATELARFRNHASANGRTQADWHAAWRNWVTSPYQTANGHHAANGKTVSDVARGMAAHRPAPWKPPPPPKQLSETEMDDQFERLGLLDLRRKVTDERKS